MSSPLNHAWRVSGARTIALALVALAVGAWLHVPLASLLLLASGLLAFGVFKLARLGGLLTSRQRVPAAAGRGIWSAMQNLLRQHQRAAAGDKRRLLHQLRAFRDAAAAMPDAVVALDLDRRVQWFDTAASRLFGLRYPQDIGAPLVDLVHAPQLVDWLHAQATEPLSDLAAPADESVRLSMSLIHYADDRSLLVARDVSQLVRLEQVRRDFVANVSHELRTPLTVVHGYLDMIEPEQFAEFEPILHELRNQSRRMTQIVEDLLTLSQLEAQQTLPQERISLRSLLEALRREAMALSQGKHEIVTELHGAQDLLGSTKELHSAFSNLVSNAVRYTPAGGRITLRWESGDEHGQLTVIDTGHGIAPQHLPRLTERFYRVSTSRSRETGGTGLGLSIVKHVLQLHQAHLEIASEPGAGSRFTCVFGAQRLLAPLSFGDAP